MVDRSLFSLLSERGQEAYARLLARPENSTGGGDLGATIRWPSPLYATEDHRIVAGEMAVIFGGNDYDWAYIQKYGGDKDWPSHKNEDQAAFASWAEDYDRRADRLARVPPNSDPNDPNVRRAVRGTYTGVWPGEGFPVPAEPREEPTTEHDTPGRLFGHAEPHDALRWGKPFDTADARATETEPHQATNRSIAASKIANQSGWYQGSPSANAPPNLPAPPTVVALSRGYGGSAADFAFNWADAMAAMGGPQPLPARAAYQIWGLANAPHDPNANALLDVGDDAGPPNAPDPPDHDWFRRGFF